MEELGVEVFLTLGSPVLQDSSSAWIALRRVGVCLLLSFGGMRNLSWSRSECVINNEQR